MISGTQLDLTDDDAKAMLQKIDHVKGLAPVVSRSCQVKYLNQNTLTQVLGTTPTYLPIRDFEVESGRMFSDFEVEHWDRVAVLGPLTASNLFGFSDPVGQVVKINGINFRIVGVLKSKGDQGWFNPDDQVIVPYTVEMHVLMGVTYLREIDVQCEEGSNLDTVQDDIFACSCDCGIRRRRGCRTMW